MKVVNTHFSNVADGQHALSISATHCGTNFAVLKGHFLKPFKSFWQKSTKIGMAFLSFCENSFCEVQFSSNSELMFKGG